MRKDLREKVLFAIHNVLRDPPFSHLQLISCRNLLIYLERSVHPQMLETFHLALQPGGYLFLGSSEFADASPRASAGEGKGCVLTVWLPERGTAAMPDLGTIRIVGLLNRR